MTLQAASLPKITIKPVMLRAVRLAAITIFGGLLAGCVRTKQTNQEHVTPVAAAVAVSGPAAPLIHTNGVLVNNDELKLSFKVGGVVSRIVVREGDIVTRGQRLAAIDQIEINAQVAQAKLLAEKSGRELERAEKLFEGRLISRGQLEDLRTQAEIARAGLQSTEFNRSYASIIAPRNGTILRRLVQERELVAAGTTVLVLGSMEEGYVVRMGLADREVVQLSLGDVGKVQLDAYPNEIFAASVTEIASGADERSGLFQVEMQLEPNTKTLLSGLVAKVSITPARAHSSTRVYVPISAIVEGDGQKASIYVLSGPIQIGAIRTVRRRRVSVAFIDGAWVAIARGLEAGEPIVTEGALYVQDKERVLIQESAVKHRS